MERPGRGAQVPLRIDLRTKITDWGFAFGGSDVADLAAGFKIIASSSGQALTQLAGLVCQNWSPLPADDGTAFRVTSGEDVFIVHMEAFTRWDERALWKMLARTGELSERERMPTLCILFALLPAGYEPQGGQFRLSVGGNPTQALWFREVRLWELAPEPWWDMFPGIMALYPLSRHQLAAEQALTAAAERIRKHEKDPRTRASLNTLLALLTKMRYPDVDVLDIIGRERMQDSPLYQELLAEGSALQCRENIAQVVQLRFGDREARQCKKLLAGINDIDRLKDLHRQAVVTRRFEQFKALLDD